MTPFSINYVKQHCFLQFFFSIDFNQNFYDGPNFASSLDFDSSFIFAGSLDIARD